MDARANQQAVDQDLPTKPSRFIRSDGERDAIDCGGICAWACRTYIRQSLSLNSAICGYERRGNGLPIELNRFKMFFVDSLLDDLVE